jgi:hypothetical protein
MTIDTNGLARLGAQIRIAELIAEVESLLEAFPGIGKAPAQLARTAKSSRPVSRKRRKMSAATKAKISAAWARRRDASAPAASPAESAAAEAPKAPRTGNISEAGRARIAAAQRKRWAALKKAKANR